jgi:hypothetical protein
MGQPQSDDNLSVARRPSDVARSCFARLERGIDEHRDDDHKADDDLLHE